jgi:hypothetical protein
VVIQGNLLCSVVYYGTPCHPERSEGSAVSLLVEKQIPRGARDDSLISVCSPGKRSAPGALMTDRSPGAASRYQSGLAIGWDDSSFFELFKEATPMHKNAPAGTYRRARRNPLSDCPLTAAFAAVGGKWKLTIIYWIARERSHFSSLQRRAAPISHKVLAEQLRELEADGLVECIPLGARRAGAGGNTGSPPTAAPCCRWWKACAFGVKAIFDTRAHTIRHRRHARCRSTQHLEAHVGAAMAAIGNGIAAIAAPAARL